MVVNTDKIMTMTSLQDFPDLSCVNQPQLMAFGTLVVSPRLMPPHLVGKSHTHWPPLSIVSVQQVMPPYDLCNSGALYNCVEWTEAEEYYVGMYIYFLLNATFN